MYRHPLRSRMLLPGLIGLALGLFLLPPAQVASLRGAALSVASPLLRLCIRHPANNQPHLVAASTSAETTAVAPERSVKECTEEIDRLNAEKVHLQDQLAKLQHVATGLGPEKDLPPTINANVIARKTLWGEELYGLDRGTNDGVRLDAGVLHRNTVVGRIVAVGSNAASFALLTHQSMRVTARLSDQRMEGVLQGASEENGEGRCKMTVFAKELALNPGEHVVTAGLDGAFPAGLWLGDVVSGKKVNSAQWELSIRPACRENCIESVQILSGSQPEVPFPATPLRGHATRGRR